MQRYALTFTIKPEYADQVKKLLAQYEPPTSVTDDGARLVSTSIFVKGDTVVRFFEIEGALPSVMRHLAASPSIRRLEHDLDPFLAEPRDLSTPEGARAFFGTAMMEHVTTRFAEVAV